MGFAAAMVTEQVNNRVANGVQSEWKLKGWSVPNRGWVKINSDGSVRGRELRASAGGLLRDDNGRWIVGYGRNIGSCSISKAELWGILDGLTVAWYYGYRRVVLESDKLFCD